jgi:hypothetical protein
MRQVAISVVLKGKEKQRSAKSSDQIVRSLVVRKSKMAALMHNVVDRPVARFRNNKNNCSSQPSMLGDTPYPETTGCYHRNLERV